VEEEGKESENREKAEEKERGKGVKEVGKESGRGVKGERTAIMYVVDASKVGGDQA
jgi:hypothetical protein